MTRLGSLIDMAGKPKLHERIRAIVLDPVSQYPYDALMDALCFNTAACIVAQYPDDLMQSAQRLAFQMTLEHYVKQMAKKDPLSKPAAGRA